MEDYPALVEATLNNGDLLKKLRPTEVSDTALLLKIRAANDADLAGGREIKNAQMLALVRAALVYACDGLSESHMIVQAIPGDEAAYWHGMIHRREGDFDNARYWFRRTGAMGVFDDLHRRASAVSSVVAAQAGWDAYLYTGLCEQEKYGEHELTNTCVKLQAIEFRAMFDDVWRKSFEP
ncbi:MAG TPA: hypothetical protein VG733_08485 [Chthoniobacteraceae bacterium]|nr:hypothetical protein [Chthoniobacteraceae bacterium]